MKLFLTYDYELFFGKTTGTVEKCIIEPTNMLMQIANKHNIKMIFFIDVGYIKKLIEYKEIYPKIKKEYILIFKQIRELVEEGHDCQLHIHPHWEDCTHDGDNWKMNTERYKLVDFSDEEISRIVIEYQSILMKITEKPVTTFRAGGWCLQPFSKIKTAFDQAELKLDSTVFPGGKFTKGNYYYDFTKVPQKSIWKFSNDLCTEDTNGNFWEYPISSYNYSALFFWKLFILGRLNPKIHKPIGDGYPMTSPGLRKKMLTKGVLLSASVDGYFITKLKTIIDQNKKKGYDETVIIGHPKASTRFALKELEKFIAKNKNNHQFLTFSEVLKKNGTR